MRRWLAVVVLALVVTLFGTSSFAQAPGATVGITWAGPDELKTRSIWTGPAWLGVSYWKDEDEGDGITAVEPYSPAYMAGLRKGDHVVAMVRVQQRWDGTYSLDPNDPPFRLPDFPAYCRPGDRVLIVFWRDDGNSWLTYKRTAYMTVAILGSK